MATATLTGNEKVKLDALKAVYDHVNGEMDDIKSALATVTGYEPIALIPKTEISTGYQTGVAISMSQATSSDTDSVIVDCSPGDVFLVTATGWTSYRTYAFVDSSNTVLSISGNSEVLINRQITAPTNAAKLVVNAKIASSPRYVYRLTPGIVTSEFESAIGDARSDIEQPYHSVNLFNWDDTGNTWGQYRDANSTLITDQSTNYGTSHLIFVKANVLYKFVTAESFGNNRVAIGVYSLGKAYKKTILATLVSGTDFATFSVNEDCYAQFNIHKTYYQQRTMFCEAALYPDVFVAYRNSMVPGEYIDLTNGVSQKDLKFTEHSRTKNLFNKNGDIIRDAYFNPGLVGTITSNANLSCQYIPFEGTGTYCFLFPKSRLGTTTKVCAFGATHNYIGRFVPTLLDDNDNAKATFVASSSTFEGDEYNAGFSDIKYLGYNFANLAVEAAMFVKDTEYPAEYVPYEDIVSLGGITVRKTDADFLTHQKGANLFNRWSGVIIGKRFNTGSSATVLEDDTSTISQYIPFEGAGTYWMYFPFAKYGSSSKVVLLDKNKAKLRSISVTKQDTSLGNVNQPGYITISDADAIDVAFLGYTTYTSDLATSMFVKASSYPAEYVAYQDSWILDGVTTLPNVPNTLYRKEALFDGDSICSGGTDLSKRGAYARRIADANHMLEYNVAVGGGSITAGLYMEETPRHWICRSVDTLYASHPNADFIILEGGTNDADVIGSILNGNVPEKFGAVSGDTDFSGNYDDETFCGAVESLFYKAITYWPHAKIGFVIAMKMGRTASPNTFLNRRAYFGKIMEICQKWGIPYLNLWDDAHMNPLIETYYDSSMTAAENAESGKFYLDSQHPTPTGYDYIAPIIEAWMRTL